MYEEDEYQMRYDEDGEEQEEAIEQDEDDEISPELWQVRFP